MKPIKHKIGFWLLISLIPAFIIFIFAIALGASETSPTALWMVLGIPMMLYLPVALVVGLILFILGSKESKRTNQAAQQYAELNGWHPISRTTWRNRKRNQTALSVHQAFNKQTFILTIETNGETTSIDEFETPVWALQFGDWLWEQLLEANTTPDKAEVAEKRAEWETTALAVISPESPLSAQRERWQMRPPLQAEVFHAPPNRYRPISHKDKTTAVVLAILLGWIGAHKFYLGHTGWGILFACVSILSGFTLAGITFLIGLAEGIIYLTKSNEEFQYIYVQERKSMF